jgi:hypothetical protein
MRAVTYILCVWTVKTVAFVLVLFDDCVLLSVSSIRPTEGLGKVCRFIALTDVFCADSWRSGVPLLPGDVSQA